MTTHLTRQIGSLLIHSETVNGETVVRVRFVNRLYERFWQRRKRRHDLSAGEAATLGAVLIGHAITVDRLALEWSISAMEQLLAQAKRERDARNSAQRLGA